MDDQQLKAHAREQAPGVNVEAAERAVRKLQGNGVWGAARSPSAILAGMNQKLLPNGTSS